MALMTKKKKKDEDDDDDDECVNLARKRMSFYSHKGQSGWPLCD